MFFRLLLSFLPVIFILVAGDLCGDWKRQSVKARCKHQDMLAEYCPKLLKDCNGRNQESEEEDEERRTTTPKSAKNPKTTTPPNKEADANFKRCCKANGVPPKCLNLCLYDATPEQFGKMFCTHRKALCENYFKQAVYCGQNAQDNRECCRSQRSPEDCEIFCDGENEFPFVNRTFTNSQGPKHLKCIQGYRQLMGCGKMEFRGEKRWKNKKRTWDNKEVFPKWGNDTLKEECDESGFYINE